MPKTKGWKLPLLGVIALVFACVMVLNRPAKLKQNPIQMPPLSAFDNAIAGLGIVEPKSEVIAIGSDYPGIVYSVTVQPGQKVAKGQELFRLDTRELDAQIETIRASIYSAELQGKQAKGLWDMAQSVASSGAVSQEHLMTKEFDTRLSYSRVKELQGKIQEIKMRRDKMIIKAPIAGEVLSVSIRKGEFASQANAEPLIRMGSLDTLHVRVDVDENYASKISKTPKAYARPRGNAELKIPLNFVRYEPFVKPKVNLQTGGQRVDTRVIQLIFSIEKSQLKLFVGQELDVYIDAH